MVNNMDINSSIDFMISLITTLAAVIGGASVVVAGLREIAKVTPTEKDDVILGKAAKILNSITLALDKVALNPPEGKARVPK